VREIGERGNSCYYLNNAVVLKVNFPVTFAYLMANHDFLFPCTNHDFFDYCALETLTYLLMSFLLINICSSSVAKHVQTTFFIRRPTVI